MFIVSLIYKGTTLLNPMSEVGEGIKLGVVTALFSNTLGMIYKPLFKSN